MKIFEVTENETLMERIGFLLSERNMTKNDLSELSGISEESVDLLMLGAATVSVLELSAISRAFKMTPSELLGIDKSIYRLIFRRTEEDISVYDEHSSIPTRKNVKTYGFSVSIIGKKRVSYLLTFNDISIDGDKVSELCRVLNRLQPRIEHLEDLVEDFICYS